MPEYKNTDNFRITEDEATEQTAWALMTAVLFYENTPQDADATKAEILRIIHKRYQVNNTPFLAGAEAFLSALTDWYKANNSGE